MSTPRAQYLAEMADLVYPFSSANESYAGLIASLADMQVRLQPSDDPLLILTAYAVGAAPDYAFSMTLASSDVTLDTTAAETETITDIDGWRFITWWFELDRNLQVILRLDRIQELESTSVSGASGARVVPRCIFVDPRHVTRISYENPEIPGRAYSAGAFGNDDDPVAGHDVAIVDGYNVSPSAVADDGEKEMPRPGVEISAVAGTGEGRYPVDCDDEAAKLRTINGVGPDEQGRLFLTDDGGCVRVSGGLADGLDGTWDGSAITVHQDCEPCLDCGAVTTIYNVLADTLRDRLVTMRDNITALIADYNSEIAARVNNVLEIFENKTTPTSTSYRVSDAGYVIRFVARSGQINDWTAIKIGPMSLTGGDSADLSMSLLPYSAFIKPPHAPSTGFTPAFDIDSQNTVADLLPTCSVVWAQFSLGFEWAGVGDPTWDSDYSATLNIPWEYQPVGGSGAESGTIEVAINVKFQEP